MKTTPAIAALAERTDRRRHALDSVLGHVSLVMLMDCLIGAAAYFAAWLIRLQVALPLTETLLPQERISAVAHPWLSLVLSQVLLLYVLGLYDDLRVLRYREILGLSFTAAITQVAFITSIFFFTERVFPRSVILLFDLLNFVSIALWRGFLKARQRRRVRRTLIVGETAEAGREILGDIEASPWMGLKVLGLVVRQPEREASDDPRCPILGSLDELDELAASRRVDEIIFASAPSWRDRALDALTKMQEQRSIRIAILPSVFDTVIGKLRHVNIRDTPLIEIRNHPDEPFERFVKRAFDLSVACLALALLSPLFLAISLTVRIFSPGPVIYRQYRVGRGGRVFRLFKFRTMIPDAEKFTGEVLASENDPRVTRLGRFLRRSRLDELPQLLNVLKGEMSFVGPRPERPSFVADFERRVPGYAARHKVKPGITGLAQVKGYYDTRAENKLRYDLAYIYNYGFVLDLMILLETLKVVITRRGS